MPYDFDLYPRRVPPYRRFCMDTGRSGVIRYQEPIV